MDAGNLRTMDLFGSKEDPIFSQPDLTPQGPVRRFKPFQGQLAIHPNLEPGLTHRQGVDHAVVVQNRAPLCGNRRV